jgi:hypothetical protein
MKLNGIVGKGSGRLGASVFTVRKGEQIVRQYTDKVSNPNTRLQVEQRAKFKLLSQLAAAVGSTGMYFSTAIGNVTKRNEFVRMNMPLATVAEGADVATIDLSLVKLTSGGFMFPIPTFNTTTNVVTIDISGVADVAGAVVVHVGTPEAGKIVGASMRVEAEDGATSITATLPSFVDRMEQIAVLVWLYRFADNAARARYEAAVQGASASQVSLAFSRMVNEGAIVVSMTEVANPTQA